MQRRHSQRRSTWRPPFDKPVDRKAFIFDLRLKKSGAVHPENWPNRTFNMTITRMSWPKHKGLALMPHGCPQHRLTRVKFWRKVRQRTAEVTESKPISSSNPQIWTSNIKSLCHSWLAAKQSMKVIRNHQKVIKTARSVAPNTIRGA